MNPIKLTVQSMGKGHCALTGRECDGIAVAFDGEPGCFLSWKALRQLIAMKIGQPTMANPTASASAAK